MFAGFIIAFSSLLPDVRLLEKFLWDLTYKYTLTHSHTHTLTHTHKQMCMPTCTPKIPAFYPNSFFRSRLQLFPVSAAWPFDSTLVLCLSPRKNTDSL